MAGGQENRIVSGRLDREGFRAGTLGGAAHSGGYISCESEVGDSHV